jgi:hypothetical protein
VDGEKNRVAGRDYVEMRVLAYFDESGAPLLPQSMRKRFPQLFAEQAVLVVMLIGVGFLLGRVL